MIEFPSKTVWAWVFLISGYFYYQLIFLFIRYLFWFLVLSWVNFSRLCLSRNLSFYSNFSDLLVWCCSWWLLIILLISLRFIRMSFLSFPILVICVFSFSLVFLTKVLLFYWSCQRINFWLHHFFVLFSCILSHWFLF